MDQKEPVEKPIDDETFRRSLEEVIGMAREHGVTVEDRSLVVVDDHGSRRWDVTVTRLQPE